VRRLSASRALLLLAAAAALTSSHDAAAFVWPNVPDIVARALAGSDVAARRAAAERLSDLPAEVATPLVLRAMGDGDSEVRVRASHAAIRHRLPRAGDIVVPWLSEADPGLKRAAAEVIRALPTDRSVLALGRTLSDADPQVRGSAAGAMGSSGLAEAVTPLLSHLDDTSPDVRAQVVAALGRLGDTRAVVPLVGRIQDQAPEVRRAAAKALGELGDARASSALVLAIRDSSTDVRVAAIAALGKLRSADAVSPLVGLITRDGANAYAGSTQYEVAVAATRALGRIGTTEAITALVSRLAESDPDSRSETRLALVEVGAPAVPALVEAIQTGSGNQPSNAALVLGSLGAREGIEAISRAIRRGSVSSRVGLRALEQVGTSDSLPLVLEYLDDADPSVRVLAANTAAALLDPTKQDGRAVDPALAVLRSPSAAWVEKEALVRLLGRTGSPRAVEGLVSLAKTKSDSLRFAVVVALGEAGEVSTGSAGGLGEARATKLRGEVDAVLLDALGDEQGDTRLAAARSLARVGSEAAVAAVLKALTVGASQDRGAAGIALGGMLARATTASTIAGALAALPSAAQAARDGLIEGIARSAAPGVAEAIATIAKGEADDRRKLAEALEGKAANTSVLEGLLRDSDSSVRAAAAWSMGSVADASKLATLTALTKDTDLYVAANATASVGRIAARTKSTDVGPTLCAALTDARHHVRINALTSLRALSLDCGGRERDLFLRDPSEEVRLAASEVVALVARKETRSVVLAEVPAPAPQQGGAPSAASSAAPASASSPAASASAASSAPAAGASAPSTAAASAPVVATPRDEVARRALRGCASDERSGVVAGRCAVLLDGLAKPRVAPSVASVETTIFVVPTGATSPAARAPFAVLRPDGLVRLGLADRRGATLEVGVSEGTLRLIGAYPLVR
jgi:HEAT repeat protein